MHCFICNCKDELDVGICSKCKREYLSGGVIVIEVVKKNKGVALPNGSYVVLSNEGFDEIFNCPPPGNKILCCQPGILSRLGLVK